MSATWPGSTASPGRDHRARVGWRARGPPQPCLLIVVTDLSGEIVALHSIDLESSTGRKSKRTSKPKLSYGPVGEGTARLGGDPTSPVLVNGEGVETTLSRFLVGPCEAHACLGRKRLVGYRVGPDGELVEGAQEQAALARAREMHARGLSLRKISAALAEQAPSSATPRCTAS